MPVTCYSRLKDLPAGYRQLFEVGRRKSFFLSRSWFELLESECLELGQEACLFGLEPEAPAEAPKALLVCRHAEDGNPLIRGRRLSSFTNFYTLDFAPLLASDGDERDGCLEELVAGITKARPRWSQITLEALDKDTRVFETLLRALRAAGFIAYPYFQFGNWYEEMGGRRYDEYQAGLPKSTRRRARTFDRRDDVKLRIITDAGDIDAGIADYELVYARSWKEPERFPGFIPGLLRSSAATGALRLGLLYVEDRPAAAEIYIVEGGRAISFKASYDEAFKKLGVGTILTAQMMKHLVDVEKVAQIDFGSGDDAYKSDWMSSRRERWGIVAFNPRTLPGLLGAARHLGGLALRRIGRRLPRKDPD